MNNYRRLRLILEQFEYIPTNVMQELCRVNGEIPDDDLLWRVKCACFNIEELPLTYATQLLNEFRRTYLFSDYEQDILDINDCQDEEEVMHMLINAVENAHVYCQGPYRPINYGIYADTIDDILEEARRQPRIQHDYFHEH